MIGLDTTVLLAHEIKEVAGHLRIRQSLEKSGKSGEGNYALCPQVLQKFFHVATDSRRFENPLSMGEALSRSRAWWEASEITQCHPGERAWQQAWSWMKEFLLRRKRLLDTYLATTYHEREVRKLATANAEDFVFFGIFQFEDWALSGGI